jgi:hypothetical protein
MMIVMALPPYTPSSAADRQGVAFSFLVQQNSRRIFQFLERLAMFQFLAYAPLTATDYPITAGNGLQR